MPIAAKAPMIPTTTRSSNKEKPPLDKEKPPLGEAPRTCLLFTDYSASTETESVEEALTTVAIVYVPLSTST